MAASDPNFLANPYLFTGRRFDIEIRRPGAGRAGLYYYRARYYNPYIGRFLQTDPVGYGVGINWYSYCGNNPLGFVDPSGLTVVDVFKNWYIVNGGKCATGYPGVHWSVLLAHYALGRGSALLFKGGEWGDLILEDLYMEVFVYNYLVTNAKNFMSRDEDTGTWNCPIPGMLGSSPTFNVNESIVKLLLGGGSLYMDATYTKEYDCNTGVITLTLDATFVYLDYMDLHPEKLYALDLAGKATEIWWNYLKPGGYAITLLSGLKAQAYPLLISTDPVTIVISWDPEKPAIINIESDWPAPQP